MTVEPNTPSEQELVGMAQHFLGRVQLTGQEVPAYSHVMRWLDVSRERSAKTEDATT